MYRRDRNETILGKIDKTCSNSFIAIKVFLRVMVNLIIFVGASFLIYASFSLYLPNMDFNQRDLLYKILSFFIIPEHIDMFIIWFCTIITSLLFIFSIKGFKIYDIIIDRYLYHEEQVEGFSIPWLLIVAEIVIFIMLYPIFSNRALGVVQVIIYSIGLVFFSYSTIKKLSHRDIKLTVIIQIITGGLFSLVAHFSIEQAPLIWLALILEILFPVLAVVIIIYGIGWLLWLW